MYDRDDFLFETSIDPEAKNNTSCVSVIQPACLCQIFLSECHTKKRPRRFVYPRSDINGRRRVRKDAIIFVTKQKIEKVEKLAACEDISCTILSILLFPKKNTKIYLENYRQNKRMHGAIT